MIEVMFCIWWMVLVASVAQEWIDRQRPVGRLRIGYTLVVGDGEGVSISCQDGHTITVEGAE